MGDGGTKNLHSAESEQVHGQRSSACEGQNTLDTATQSTGMTTPNATTGRADDLTQQTQRYWGKRTGANVSDEDAREAVRSIAAFFDLLAQWDGATEEREPSEAGEEL